MLYLVGIGLSPRHISVEGVEICQKAKSIFLDAYTTPYSENMRKALEDIIGRPVIPVQRPFLEGNLKEIKKLSSHHDVVLLVWGDPLAATTHISLILELEKAGIQVTYIPGVSILSALPSLLGLQHYKFGPPVTIPHFWEQAPSFAKKVKENMEKGLHTIVLLDVDPPVTVNEGARALEKFLGDLWAVGVARAFWNDQKVVYAPLHELEQENWGPLPHVIVVPGKLHPLEAESLGRFRKKGC